MHYIRFLRPPQMGETKRAMWVELVMEITTDLSDSLLSPHKPLDLLVMVGCAEMKHVQAWPAATDRPFIWRAGDRVLKVNVPLSPAIIGDFQADRPIDIRLSPRSQQASATGLRSIISGAKDGLVMPVWAILQRGQTHDAVTRKLELDVMDGVLALKVNEDIGESMARHIWDGGVVSICSIAAIKSMPESTSSQGPCMKALAEILTVNQPLNILEVGCGIGTLGLGVASVLPGLHPTPEDCVVLMTDVPDAESQARSNIAQRPDKTVPVLYENLDWEDGRQGTFGAEVGSRSWDLIILSDCTYNTDTLPTLVETLSALHTGNKTHSPNNTGTHVFLATKPRHDSEEAVFGLLESEKWTTVAKQTVPLPVLGGDAQSVELHLFRKT